MGGTSSQRQTARRNPDPLRRVKRRSHRECHDGRRAGQGSTVIENAAIEPEITSLAEFLVSMGLISMGSHERLEVEGVDTLHAADVKTIPDRIEAGTFSCRSRDHGGEVTLTDVNPEHFTAVSSKLEDAGCTVAVTENSVTLTLPKRSALSISPPRSILAFRRTCSAMDRLDGDRFGNIRDYRCGLF